jgi:transmembrane sensor
MGNKKLNSEEQNKQQLLWFLWLHNYLHRYYNNQVSAEEKETIEGWDLSSVADSTIEPSEKMVKKGVDKVWARLSEQYGFTHHKKPVNVFRLQKSLRYAAAAVLLVAGSVTAYQYLAYNSFQSMGYLFSARMKYTTDNVGVNRFVLPDGSAITLNGNTTIAFLKDEFNKKQREVWLEDGEVFFDVAKNPDKPFIIHSPDADVVVRGTSFSVTAYKKLSKSNVAVRTGKVEVRTANKKINMLFPAQALSIDKNAGGIELSEVKTSNVAAWKDGGLVFSHCNADELVLRMEQHFDVKLTVQPGILEDVSISANFKKDIRIKDVLQVIADIYGIKYSITNNTVTLYK